MESRRIKITIEYDGTNFHGFQSQKEPQSELPTIQGAIEEALLKITGQNISLQVAGRTDSGVHALGQVCHFDIKSKHELVAFKDGINRFTPTTISVISAENISQKFQARFDCYARNYEYFIYNRRTASPFWIGRAMHIQKPLNVEAMQKAAECFIGDHDFSAFRSPDCTAKSPVKKMHIFKIEKDGDMIKFTIRGSAFLHNMVRIMCGTLVMVGKGKMPAEEVKQILEAKNKHASPLTLNSEGLYFTKAEYPEFEVFEKC